MISRWAEPFEVAGEDALDAARALQVGRLRAHGEPVGRPVKDPYIPMLAVTVEQVEEPAQPAGTITNGTYEIGTEVAPGKYKSAGPESGLISLCYVDVQRGDDFLAQEVSNDGQVRIEIKESWKGALMEVSGCQPLVKQ